MTKVFVTGHNGAIGQLLIQRLLSDEIEVIVPTENSLIQDPNYFDTAVDQNISVVYHLAAKSFVPDSWIDPSGFYETNVLGTVKVLEFCRRNQVPLVFISSYVYGNPQYLPINEEHTVHASNPYALSKIHAENLIQFYGDNYSLKYNIIRPFNIFGSQGNRKMLIPEIIEQIQEKKEIIVKDLKPRRDQLYIDDLIDLLVKAKDQYYNESFNAGSGISYSVEEMVATCQKVWGTNLPVSDISEQRINEINETICDYSKAKKVFKWEPKYNLEQGLQKFKSQN